MGARPTVPFASLLKDYRLAAGLTQEALAERAGVSARNIQNLERGENRPLRDTARRLAEALGLGERDRALLLTAVIPVPRRRTAPAAQPAPRCPVEPDPPVAGTARVMWAAEALPVAGPHQNLPVALSSFIGRDSARARVGELLASHRLVTLTGTGGVGKTRLALAVAEGVLAAYRDGVWLVELASLADPALVPGTVAAALDLREETGRPILQTLVDHLKARQLLLVLDNCEHLVPACAALAGALLHACPILCILATSREGLGLAGERRYLVPPLSVPDLRQLQVPELAGTYEAVRLFVERAQERDDRFALTEWNARSIAAVCARLDGLPLAIELAAARTASTPVEAIAARLDDRFRLLTGGHRDLPLRQRTLRAALDWSWDLLAAGERALLARLVVFAGAWTLEAAETVCPGEGLEPWAVLDALDALIGKSLVQADEGREGEGRYRLLETVRQYAAQRLAEAGELSALRDRHLAWCLELTQGLEPRLTGPAQGGWLDWLETEHDNLRAALRWAQESGAGEKGLRLAGALWRFWGIRGHLREGRGWLEGALAGGKGGSPAARARALHGAGSLAENQGEYGQAVALHEEALAIRRTLGDRHGIAASLNNLGLVVQAQSDYGRATALYEESLALWRVLGEQPGIASTLNNLGEVARKQGEDGRAVALYEESLTIRRALGNKRGIAITLANLGLVAYQQGDGAWALRLQREGLVLAREIGALNQVAVGLGELVATVNALGEPLRAARLGGAAEALRETLGLPLTPDERGAQERVVGGMCAGLGEQLFVAAWAEGRALTPDQAIAQALEGLRAAPGAPVPLAGTSTGDAPREDTVPQPQERQRGPTEGPATARLSRRERQAWALEHLRTAGSLSPQAYARTLDVSVDTALIDLHELMAQGLVRAAGTTKDRRYTLRVDEV